MKLFKKLFPCRFNNPKCKDSSFGCKCGVIGTTAALIGIGIAGAAAVGSAAISSSAQKKAMSRAEELAQEQQSQAITEQRRLEEKYGLTPGELSREQRLLGIPEGDSAINISEGLEAKRQKETERRAGLSGEELLREAGPETRNLLDEIAARQGKTGEELFRGEGSTATAYADQMFGEAKDPGKSFEDTLPQQLELARQMVNAEANKRGVFGGQPEGGIRFENLGRAGVDLAIKSATARQDARQQSLSNAFQVIQSYQNLSSTARGEAGTVGERALTEKERSRTELAQFLQDLQQQSASSKGRAAQVGTGASNTAQQTISQGYGTLIDVAGARGGIVGPAEAGLGAIGDIASQVSLEQLLKTPSKTPTGSTPTDLAGFRQAGADYDPYEELAGMTGSDIIARKRAGFARY